MCDTTKSTTGPVRGDPETGAGERDSLARGVRLDRVPDRPQRSGTMVNRLKEYLEEPEERPPELEEYWLVATPWDIHYVTAEEARKVNRQMDRILPWRWVRFVDVYGSRVRVRKAWIGQVRESTKSQRSTERQFRRAQREEEKSERRPWEEEY